MFTDDINIFGRHAYYVKELASKEIGLFPRNIDVFMNGAIIGLIYGRKEERDKVSDLKEEKTNILASAINKEKIHLDYIYRLIMLLDDSEGLSLEERINRAFRDDSNSDISDKHQNNLELFKEYSLGGISILYDKILKEGIDADAFMKNSYEFIKSTSEELNEENANAILNSL